MSGPAPETPTQLLARLRAALNEAEYSRPS